MMKITGFTLFWNPQRKSWQRSTRPEGESGWLVEFISDAEAQRHFEVLRSTENLDEALEGAGEAFQRLTEAFEGMPL